MGHHRAFLIAYPDLERLCPAEIAALESAADAAERSTDIDAAELWVVLARADADSDGDASHLAEGIAEILADDGDLAETVAAETGREFAGLLAALKEAFTRRTGGLALRLHPLSMDADFGDCVRPPVVNPPLHAFVFIVDNMLGLTPAGERFKHEVTEYRWFDE